MNSLKHLIAGLALAALMMAGLPHQQAQAVILCNNAWENTATTGTGSLVVSGALSGAQTFEDCGITNGQDIRYRIFDGAAWEVGHGTYTTADNTLTRTVLESSNADSAINLSGTANVIITPLTQDLPSESTPTEASPTASDYLFILQSGVFERSQVSALESALEGFLDAADLQGDIALTTDTSGNYVKDVADGTGIDGTAAAEGATYTPSFDATELTTNTWGVNNYTTDVFSTDGVDLTWDYSTTDAIATLSGGGTSPGIALDDQGVLRFLEEDAGGSNYKELVAPAAVTANTTCTLEDDANFIPDSCVGDGSDDDVPEVGDFTNLVGGSGIDNNSGTLDLDLTELSSATFGAGAFTTLTFDAGATDPLFSFGSGTILAEGVASVRQADAANAGGFFKWLEDPGTGSNFIGIQAPASITSDVTCTLENDSNPIPDSCVGDGSDSGAVGKTAMWIPGGALIPRTTNGCAIADLELATNKIMLRTCNYDASTEEGAGFTVRMPDGWDEGTLTVVPVWAHPSTATNFGVVWGFSCLATSNDDAMDAALGTQVTSTDTGGTTTDQYTGPETSAMTCSGTPAAGDTIYIEAERVAANGSDTLAVDAYLLGFTVYFTRNAVIEP